MWAVNLTVIIMLVGMIWFSFALYNARRKIQRESQQTIQWIERQSEVYRTLAAHGFESRAIKHDLQKQLQFNSLLGEHASLEEVIQAITICYREKTEKLGIHFQTQVDKQGSLPFDQTEIISVLVNLLDNAVEASFRVKENPFISMSIHSEGQGMEICVKNSKLADVHPLENHMATTKADDREHGYGTKIISDIIEKHGGTITYEDRDDTFVITITVMEE